MDPYSVIDKCGLTDEQIGEFKEVFMLFDKDRDGILTTQEVIMTLRALGHQSTEAELMQVINEIAELGEGTLDFSEFVQMMSSFMKQSDPQEELRDLFETFDKDKDGYISAGELKYMMTSLGESFTDTEILEMIKVADIDGDGLVSYAEFAKIMESK